MKAAIHRHEKHIKHLKKHRNILYATVVVLFVMQLATFFVVSSQASEIIGNQNKIEKIFSEGLSDLKSDTQYKINALVRELTEQREEFGTRLSIQKSDFEREIELLKKSQSDFSAVIEDVIKGVVSVGTDSAAGSGFIVHSSGYVVTNQHIIENARFVQVLTYDNQVYDAVVIGQDANADIALLKIGGIFEDIELGNSDNVQIGEKVIAIGNPLGLSFTVTEGIVSAVDREGPNGLKTYIQTDVTLNPGNSGGPLINKEGKVIGMNNFKIGGAEGLGFALESNVIKQTINSLANEIIV